MPHYDDREIVLSPHAKSAPQSKHCKRRASERRISTQQLHHKSVTAPRFGSVVATVYRKKTRQHFFRRTVALRVDPGLFIGKNGSSVKALNQEYRVICSVKKDEVEVSGSVQSDVDRACTHILQMKPRHREVVALKNAGKFVRRHKKNTERKYGVRIYVSTEGEASVVGSKEAVRAALKAMDVYILKT